MEQGTFDFASEDVPAPAKLCGCGCGKPTPIASKTFKKRGQAKGQPLKFIRGHRAGVRGGPPRKLFIETGQRIGRSVVIDPDVPIREPAKGCFSRGARLLCDCGGEYERRLFVLLKSKDASCGCVAGQFSDRTGQRFGNLIAIRPVQRDPEITGVSTKWLCRCDCGNEVAVSSTSLANGHTKSCGCRDRALPEGYLPGDAARNRVYRSYLKNAETRGLLWELTGADFERLTARDCHYCGAPPGMTAKSYSRGGGEWVYNGIDRIDSKQGYRLGNVITACKICNHAKRDLPYDDFLAWIARLTEYHFFHPEVMPSRLLTR